MGNTGDVEQGRHDAQDLPASLRVGDRAGVDPALGRGLDAEELAGALARIGFDVGETWRPAASRPELDAAFAALHQDLLPVLRVAWVDEGTHDLATAMVLAANRRALSLVDATSFHVMRRLGLTAAFAFDPHFGEQGFVTLP